MATVEYAGAQCVLAEGESVLDGLLRSGVSVPYSCKAGSCGSCLMRASAGAVPAKAQAGLKDAWRERGYFLACVCKPESDMVAGPVDADVRVEAAVGAIDWLSDSVLRARLICEAPFDYRAGQYLTLFRPDGLGRSYSLASLPGEGALELHVRVLPEGKMSQWLAREAVPGAVVTLQGPAGDCFYVEGRQDQPLLLVGTGTGLAPLYGIARDALASGHRGPVTLYHGAAVEAGLYLQDALHDVAARHANFTYVPTTLDRDGPIDKAVLARHADLEGWRAFLCGDPAIVTNLKKKIFLAGAALNDIHADAFLPSA